MSSQVFTGRYQMVRQLARGGMAEVYLARDLLLDRPVALKVLFPQFSADMSFVERFRREARAAANLNHPNIVSIFDWGEDDGTYFIVMEYVDGRTLREILHADGPIPAIEVATIGADIAGALHFAHLNGVIHRDVKPGNVMVARNHVKVTDFGIARAGDPSESLTQAGAVMGTATYFSPEQAQGQTVDPRSDVYSLGVVLYELVAGRPPFVGDSPLAIAYQHVREEADPPSQHNPEVSPVFDAIVMKAMSKNRANRQSSADELRTELVAFAQGRSPAVALPPPPPPPVRPADATLIAPPPRPSADGTRVLDRRGVVVDRPVPQRARTGTYIAILVGLLAALGGLLYLLSRELGVGKSAQVAVPRVIGDTEEVATRKLEDADLRVRREEVVDLANPPGRVVDQVPEPSARVASNSFVTIKVASQAPPAPVPNVVNLKADVASARLVAAGFKVSQDRQPNDRIAPDVVFDQQPKAGTQAPAGSVVTLVVSRGPEEVRVPDVRSRDAADAANVLGQAGFRTSSRSEPSANVPSGKVIRTEPDATTTLSKGSTVIMIVSSGPVPTTVEATTTTSSTTTSSSTTVSPPTT
ncbi:MAG: Stk1 family PASTA domain-containing Ser/Thr kinase [Acidimicrobiales bacterium]